MIAAALHKKPLEKQRTDGSDDEDSGLKKQKQFKRPDEEQVKSKGPSIFAQSSEIATKKLPQAQEIYDFRQHDEMSNEEDEDSHLSQKKEKEVKSDLEEPQVEPMAPHLQEPDPEKSDGQDKKSGSHHEDKESNSSSSEFDIYTPRSSDSHSHKEQDEDNKLANLQQEAKALDKILPFFVINPYSKFKQTWDILMMILLIYTILVLPIRLAFETDADKLFYLDISVDSLFFIDIIINFMTAYEDERGVVVIDRKKIAIHYMKGWFTIDFFSTLPIYAITDQLSLSKTSANYNNILRFLRIPRLYKLAKVVRIFQMERFPLLDHFLLFLKLNKEYSLILKFTGITLVLIHITGCIWFFIGTLTPQNNWILANNLDDKGTFEQYIASIYFVLTVLSTVGYGNIVPTNNTEYIFVLFFMFVGVAFFAYVMGTLTFTFSKLSEKVTLIKEREIFFNELAHTYQLPYATHEKLLMCVQSSIFSNSNQVLQIYQEEPVFSDLPPLIQGLLCEFLFKDIIKKTRFLQGKPKGFLRKLFQALTPNFLNLGDAIYFKGEPAEYVYFVIKGRLATKCEDHNNKLRTLIHVEGSYFGEVDILVSRARGESAIAEMDSEVWKVDKDTFLRLLNEFEDVKMEVLDYAIKKEKSRKSTAKIVKNKNFLELIGRNKQDEVTLTKTHFLIKVKEKLINNVNELVRDKNQEEQREIFRNIQEMDQFIARVKDYDKIREKLKLPPETPKEPYFVDNEVEESILKGLKIQAHLQDIQEYIK